MTCKLEKSLMRKYGIKYSVAREITVQARANLSSPRFGGGGGGGGKAATTTKKKVMFTDELEIECAEIYDAEYRRKNSSGSADSVDSFLFGADGGDISGELSPPPMPRRQISIPLAPCGGDDEHDENNQDDDEASCVQASLSSGAHSAFREGGAAVQDGDDASTRGGGSPLPSCLNSKMKYGTPTGVQRISAVLAMEQEMMSQQQQLRSPIKSPTRRITTSPRRVSTTTTNSKAAMIARRPRSPPASCAMMAAQVGAPPLQYLEERGSSGNRNSNAFGGYDSSDTDDTSSTTRDESSEEDDGSATSGVLELLRQHRSRNGSITVRGNNFSSDFNSGSDDFTNSRGCSSCSDLVTDDHDHDERNGPTNRSPVTQQSSFSMIEPGKLRPTTFDRRRGSDYSPPFSSPTSSPTRNNGGSSRRRCGSAPKLPTRQRTVEDMDAAVSKMNLSASSLSSSPSASPVKPKRKSSLLSLLDAD